MDISYAIENDAEVISALFEDVVGQASVYNEHARTSQIEIFTASHIESLIAADEKSIAVARVGGAITGFVITEFQDGPIWIEWICVDAKFRKKHIAEALIAFCLSEAPSRNCHKYWCDTRDVNEPAVKLFTKMGFTKMCTLENHWYGQNFCIWARDIS